MTRMELRDRIPLQKSWTNQIPFLCRKFAQELLQVLELPSGAKKMPQVRGPVDFRSIRIPVLQVLK